MTLATSSILTTVKNGIGGIQEDDTFFDDELITHINTALGVLTQLGFGPVEGFNIEGATETWNDLYPNMPPKLSYVKTFVIQKVRLLFDPPASAAVSEALNNSLSELTYRLVTDLE